jgi:uncharacterized membrane protein
LIMSPVTVVGRALVEETASELRITIPSRFTFLGLFHCLCAAVFAFVLAWSGSHMPPGLRAFLLVCFSPCIAIGILGALNMAWILFGRLVIVATDRTLVIRSEIFKLGFARRYDRTQVRSLYRVPPPTERPARDLYWAHPLLVLEYGKRTIRFGRGLQVGDADALIDRLANRRRWQPPGLADR